MLGVMARGAGHPGKKKLRRNNGIFIKHTHAK